jgi:hypothetical protein
MAFSRRITVMVACGKPVGACFEELLQHGVFGLKKIMMALN